MLSRTAIAEIYRYAVSLSRISQVSERHQLNPQGNFEVTLTWK